MDVSGAIISGLLGAGGIISFVQFMISRHDTKDERLIRIEHKIDTSLEKSDRNELATTRLQLLFLIQMQPDNKDAILQTAQRYFMELDGNGEAWDAFKRWADNNGVDTGYYQAHITHERREHEVKKENNQATIYCSRPALFCGLCEECKVKEEWKPICGYEGIYDVSNYGRVRSYPRNGTRDKRVHILKPSITRRGDKKVSLFRNNSAKYATIHQLVAQAFIPNPDGKTEVNHKDGDPSNNNVNNLEWVTKSENHLHRVYVLNKNALKACRQVICLETGVIYKSVRSAARAIGCNHKSIQRAASGIYSQAHGYHWRYK